MSEKTKKQKILLFVPSRPISRNQFCRLMVGFRVDGHRGACVSGGPDLSIFHIPTQNAQLQVHSIATGTAGLLIICTQGILMKLELPLLVKEESMVMYLKASQYTFLSTECLFPSLSIATGVHMEQIISIQQIQQLCLVTMASMDTDMKALLGTVIQDVIGHITITGKRLLSTSTGKLMVQIISTPLIAQRLEPPFLVGLENMVTNMRA